MPAARRTNITRVVRAIVQDAAAKLPELAHIRASRVLVVAGEARRASWATIRPLGPPGDGRLRPVVRVKGKQMLYVITLRPRFFRSATLHKRVETILHELFHISKRFDGTLHRGRLHSRLASRFERRLAPLVSRYLKLIPDELRQALSAHGTVAARQWLERPGPSLKKGQTRLTGRKIYTERQLFLGVVQMISRPSKPTGSALH
jgi:predicted metallopeptidase